MGIKYHLYSDCGPLGSERQYPTPGCVGVAEGAGSLLVHFLAEPGGTEVDLCPAHRQRRSDWIESFLHCRLRWHSPSLRSGQALAAMSIQLTSEPEIYVSRYRRYKANTSVSELGMTKYLIYPEGQSIHLPYAFWIFAAVQELPRYARLHPVFFGLRKIRIL